MTSSHQSSQIDANDAQEPSILSHPLRPESSSQSQSISALDTTPQQRSSLSTMEESETSRDHAQFACSDVKPESVESSEPMMNSKAMGSQQIVDLTLSDTEDNSAEPVTVTISGLDAPSVAGLEGLYQRMTSNDVNHSRTTSRQPPLLEPEQQHSQVEHGKQTVQEQERQVIEQTQAESLEREREQQLMDLDNELMIRVQEESSTLARNRLQGQSSQVHSDPIQLLVAVENVKNMDKSDTEDISHKDKKQIIEETSLIPSTESIPEEEPDTKRRRFAREFKEKDSRKKHDLPDQHGESQNDTTNSTKDQNLPLPLASVAEMDLDNTMQTLPKETSETSDDSSYKGSIDRSSDDEDTYSISSDNESPTIRKSRRHLKTGYVYDVFMTFHATTGEVDEVHPEDPLRIYAIYRELLKHGYLDSCHRIPIRLAESSEILKVHTVAQYATIKSTERMVDPDEFVEFQSKFDSLYFNEHTFESSLYAAGGVVEACNAVVRDEVKNAFAIVRPPGHHSTGQESMGFCMFNNVAIAVRSCIGSNDVNRILILDWDIHFGNGTQRIFDSDPNVLYVSLHRYEDNTFYPQDQNGSAGYVGTDKGEGRTLNIPWPRSGMTDGDYLYAFQQVIMPIAIEFDPDLVIVSAGFDAAHGDFIGRCHVSPAGYSQMTHMLMSLANGRLVMALEGGYNVTSIAKSARACMSVMLGEAPMSLPHCHPSKECIQTIKQVKDIHSRYWVSLRT